MKANKPNFEDVQKALALKRHEQPKPAFFSGFNQEVIQRIHEPGPPRPLTWSDRLGLGEDARPFWLCGLGVLVCAVLVGTLIASLRVDKPESNLDPRLNQNSAALSNQFNAQPVPGFEALPGQHGERPSTAPVLAPEDGGDSLPAFPQAKKP